MNITGSTSPLYGSTIHSFSDTTSTFIPELPIISDLPMDSHASDSSSMDEEPKIADLKTKNTTVHKKRRKSGLFGTSAKKKGRIIFPIGDAPSLLQEQTDKEKGNANPQSIIHHAYMRMQLFAIAVVALYGIAKRTHPKADRDIEIIIRNATLQVGKATKEGDWIFHAAHSDPAAGKKEKVNYKDAKNIKDIFAIEISEDKEITPNKIRILTGRGFTEKEFEQMKENCYNINKVMEVIDSVWLTRKNDSLSILSGTYTEKVLNTAVEVPEVVNLGCDKDLENNIRPKVEALYNQVMHAEISPEKACEQYHNYINKYFSYVVKTELPTRLIKLTNYSAELKKLKFFEISKIFKKYEIEAEKQFNEILIKIVILKSEISSKITTLCNKFNLTSKNEKTILKNLFNINFQNFSSKIEANNEKKLPSNEITQFLMDLEKIESKMRDEFILEYKIFSKEECTQILKRFSAVNSDNQKDLLIDFSEISKKNVEDFLLELYQKISELIPKKKKKTPKADSSITTVSALITEDCPFKISSIKLPLNKKSLTKFIHNKSKIVDSYDLLLNEIKKQKKKFINYLFYAQLELSGTQIPDFKLLFGKIYPNSDEKESTPENWVYEQQKELLKPITFVENEREEEEKLIIKSKPIKKKLNFDSCL